MQYRDKPKAIAHTGNVLSAGMIYDTAIAVRDGFNIETAIGAQLDIIGKWLGVGRTITGTTFTRAYYGYALYGDTTPFLFNPMLLYGVEPPDAQFRDYKESTQSLYDLTDEEYRVILKLAIVRNTSNASVKTIDDILNVLFGTECYFIDRMNMTVVSYMVGTKWSRVFGIAKSSGLLPNPAGVGTALVVVPDINNIFSYSLYGGEAPSFAVGYASYAELGEFDFDLNAPTEYFYGACTDPAGNKWFTTKKETPTDTGKIFVVYAGTQEYIDVGADDLDYRHICADGDGNVFVAVYGGKIRKALAGSTTFTDVTSSDSNWEGIAVDPSGNVWATINGGGLYVSNNGGASFDPVYGPTAYRGICSDDEGNIFVSFLYSLAMILAGTTTVLPIDSPSGEYNGVTVKNGVLWTAGEYIWKASLDDLVFSQIEQGTFFPREMNGITIDAEGSVLIPSTTFVLKAELNQDVIGCMASYS